MKNICLLFSLVLTFAACEKSDPVEEQDYVAAVVGGNAWTTNAVSSETNGGSDQVLSFTGARADGTAISFNIAGLPTSLPPGDYFFRETNVLPATFMSFSTSLANDGVHVNWATSMEQDLMAFVIERTQDTSFSSIDTIPPTNTANPAFYEYVDSTVNNLSGYHYRIKAVNNDSTFEYSNVSVIHLQHVSYWQEQGIKYKGFNGVLTITLHDHEKRILAGRFSFDTRNNEGVLIMVRNGSFKFTY